ncbi:unnamed protein product [Notodromas monacha]|uniref:Phosphatidylinositol glycan anchor biosynthesis class U protein n=1 Tax=Notodromas monacha TaxID=399045 RepID=A0A7R9GBG4_9CRUS|nr:unnamed protein product [Notodromas monacha]CAG0916486.1 unnamed protein product [Notodromas monacha]
MLHLLPWLLTGFVTRYFFSRVKLLSGFVDSSLISTPSNSWHRMKEGHFLWSRGIDPYDGDVFHGTPLTLYLSSLLFRYSGHNEAIISAVLCLLDVTVGAILYFAVWRLMESMVEKERVNKSLFNGDSAKSMMLKTDDISRAAGNVLKAYTFCPFTVLNASETTTVLSNVLVALSLLCIGYRKFTLLGAFLALCAYEDFYPIVLFVPAAYMAWETQKKQNFLGFCCAYVSTILIVLFASFALTGGSWSFLSARYGFLWNVPDLTPNIGLFWYFFTEMFEHFRMFFICSFQINAFIYAAPLLIKFRREPILVVYSLIVLTAIFKSYPCIGDVGFYLSILPMWSHLAATMRQMLITFCFFVATLVLAPVLWHLWLFDGSANANFFFGITLGFAAAQILLLSDILFAYMRRDYELIHGRKRHDKPYVLALQ